ncbi:hypothetical protein JCGZ_14512 [Jatropha curcas]|uniref:EF-hand domain-containing protein n=1 Tax=Jatropha curcas TaxID=180498 RepID=A0A067JXS4_JATCU|nr:probable calcium-binding protein CML27 [Jatropha curcas]KDP28741.1 hypothetical protein JCGZ_14512 [Jatropha curcas]
MLHSFTTCLSSLRRRVIAKLTKHKRNLSSSTFDFSDTPSFASMEIPNQFKQVFNLIDANGDGKISSYDLIELLLCLGCDKSKAKAEAEGMVKELDRNGDGFVDFDEFFYILNNYDEEDYLMDAFMIFDADKNGLISAKELQKVLSRLGFEKCSLKECRIMIKGVDKDGDGFVDFEEFRSMMTANWELKDN